MITPRIFDMSSSDLWQLVEAQRKTRESNKPLHSLEIPAAEVQDLVDPIMKDYRLLDRAANHLASRIQAGKITFPYKTVSEEQRNSLVRELCNWKGVTQEPGLELVASCTEDGGRSHVILPYIGRWAANHDYSQFWKPICLKLDDQMAVIQPPVVGTKELIDLCTHDRLDAATGKLLPSEGWDKELSKVCKEVLLGRVTSQNPSHAFTERDFREACIKEFPCAPHFSPEVLHSIISIVQCRSPEVFTKGVLLLDTEVEYGHRFAAALCNPSVTYMATCDSRVNVSDKSVIRYGAIFEAIKQGNPSLDAEFLLDCWGVSPKSFCGKTQDRKFKIFGGITKSSNNSIYKVDTLYNLVFSRASQEFDTHTLENSWDVLSPGGYFAVYTSDEHTPGYIRGLMDFMVTRLKGEYVGMIPCKKPLSPERWQELFDKKIGVTDALDPIWIYQKAK